MSAELMKKEVVAELIHNKIVVTKTLLDELNNPDSLEKYYMKYCAKPRTEIKSETKVKIQEIEKPRQISGTSVKVVHHYETEEKKWLVKDFVSYLNTRFKSIEKMLYGRQDLTNLTSISRLKNVGERQTVSIIGMVVEKDLTKNDNFIFTVEDKTGVTKVLVSKNSEIYSLAKDIMLDEVIGITGSTGKDIIFSTRVIYPDIHLQDLKKCEDDVYAMVISDMHVGSMNFLPEKFEAFLEWINGKSANPEQQELAAKVKYIFVVGDLIEGVGIYPKQEDELAIKDIYAQYKTAADYLKRIPQDKQLIITPGNHEAVRLSEPQPRFDKKFAAPLWEIKNAIIFANPCTINIHSSETFSGFNVLIYHGYSYTYYSDNVDSIRMSGRNISDRTDLVMKYLLQRRHLAPSHGSNLYVPDPNKDALVIETVPDFFISGHIHKIAMTHYRGVDIICGSCWQSASTFQEKMGHTPEPCKVPIINLKTRKISILDFT